MTTMAGLKRKYGTSAFVGRRRLSEKVTGGRPRGFRGGAQFARRALLGLMEKKVVDTASASYACDTTGSVTLVNGMAQGSDFTNRIGRKYTNVAVQLEGFLSPQDSTVGTTKCRIMLIYDTQPNSALPVITDVLTASTSSSFMNLNNRDRFKVLCDENYTLGPVNNTASQAFAGSPTAQNISIYKKINLETICDGTTAAIGDVQSGSIFLLTIGSSAPAFAFDFIGAVRTRFIDA